MRDAVNGKWGWIMRSILHNSIEGIDEIIIFVDRLGVGF